MTLVPLLLAAVLIGLALYTAVLASRLDARYPPRGRFTPIPGGRLHVVERAAIGPERATVLLIHGASGNGSDLMLPLGDALATRGFRVIAVDRPGLGWSDRPGGRDDADPARQAALIRAGLAAMGVNNAIVVGHSLAGMASTALALDDPAFTRGLVLIAPVTHPWPGGEIDWYYNLASTPFVGEAFTRTLSLPFGMAAFSGGLASVFAPQPPPPDYVERTGLLRGLRPKIFRANAQDVAQAFGAVTRQAPRLGAIRAPTAIVTGDRDGIVLTKIHSYGSARDIPGATLEVLAGVGHSPHWAAPDKVIDAIVSVAARGEGNHAAAQ